jgi:hypothetical protein
LVGGVAWKCFPYLLHHPIAGRVWVTLKCRMCLRSWAMMKKQYSTPNMAVGP